MEPSQRTHRRKYTCTFNPHFSKNFLGLGIDTIERACNGERIAWYFFLVKIIFTSITLSFRGSGGIITPIFFVGATAGSFLDNFLHFDRATLSAIGMINLLASAKILLLLQVLCL